MKKTEFSSALLREAYTRIEHPTGLTVYVFPKKMTATYALFAVNYGSVDTSLPRDAGGESLPDGVAHFLEHKLFEDENGEDAFAAFSAYGADVNAYTSYGRTAYLFSTTAHISECLRELLTFVTHPHFTEESVEREKGIIAQEIRMYEDQPWERAYSNMLSALFHSHPIRRRICGSVASIGRITPALLRRAYDAYYRLSNMALIVCGDVTEEEILQTVSETLGECGEVAPAPKREKIYETGGAYRTRVTAKMQVAKPLFCIGIKDDVPQMSTREESRRELAMSLLCELLFSQSGELFESLYEQGIINALNWEYTTVEGAAFVCLSADSDEPETVLSRLQEYLARIAEKGIDPEEFENARRVRYASEVLLYDSTEGIASALLDYTAFDGEEIFDVPATLLDIKIEELNTLLRDVLCNQDSFVLSTVTPLEETEERSTT